MSNLSVMQHCPKCNNNVPNNANFCNSCGTSLTTTQNQHPAYQQQPVINIVNTNTNSNINTLGQGSMISSKSKTLTLILCCIGFFGFAGLHRLYVGKIISGILYFCTVGFFFIGTIIDLLKISSGTFTDGAGLVIRN